MLAFDKTDKERGVQKKHYVAMHMVAMRDWNHTLHTSIYTVGQWNRRTFIFL